MTDTIKEQLSAFLDGELPEAETTLLLKRLERDDDLKGTLSRYSLIGAALRADGEVTAARHVANRVRAAIAVEPALPAAPGLAAARWIRPLAGLGVAASVAAATLLAIPQWTAGTGGVDVAPAQVALEAAPDAAPAVAAGEERAADEPLPSYTIPPAPAGTGSLAGAQLAAYLVAHSEFTSPLSRRTVIVAPPAEAPAAPAASAAPAEAGQGYAR
jgi:sigma-E factor negative regulatory protein RseA